ncbi:dirigent protein [Streptoalloteichus hindustanus]|uniref:Dirigent-like protein n=1 Tax=Streptoalloteichus hindustanus TaxID=2017 RepID=A0A1M5GN54_STRHI|nr:dirigent protein [Streptoalloteichus hindustanus]SHG05088.1 Dirigent-like protein [Streptoalloteichus hindustanus]
MNRTLAIAGAVALTGVLAGAGLSTLGGPAAAETEAAGRAVTLDLHVANDQFAAHDIGQPGKSLGDMTVYSDKMVRDGREVGEDGGTCVVTHVDGPRSISNCVLTIRLAEGQLTAQGLWDDGTSPMQMAITGGTGAYRNARGYLQAWDIHTPKERYRIQVSL